MILFQGQSIMLHVWRYSSTPQIYNGLPIHDMINDLQLKHLSNTFAIPMDSNPALNPVG